MPQFDPLPATIPDGYVASLVQKGRDQAQAGRLQDAFTSYAQALTLAPDDPAALIDYGCALIESKNYPEGRRMTARALELPIDPAKQAICWNNLSFMDYAERRIDTALDGYARAMELDPLYKVPIVSRGAALVTVGRFEEAYELFERAALLYPGDWEPIINKAIVKLTLGDWELGLPGYEHRKLDATATPIEKAWNCPRWKGEDLTGRNIVVWPDQGNGDCIWTHRLVGELVRRGARNVYFAAYPWMEDILPVPEGVTLVHVGDRIEQCHYQVPCMSLMYGLRIRPDRVPPPAGLLVPPAARRRWAGLAGKFRVGVQWSGNPNHKYDDLRSIPLQQFATIREGLPAGVELHALQKDIRPADMAALDGSGIRWAGEGEITTFADVAAIVEQMDLVISVDTATLHVAAEMGRSTWGLIPHSPDFRWGTTGDRCTWYPALTMYRNPTPLGAWGPVLERVRVDLRGRIDGRHEVLNQCEGP